MSASARVLVVGGTGRLGRKVAEALCAAGRTPVVLGRSADPNSVPRGAIACAADACDPAQVAQALDDVDAVVTALSIPRASRSPFAPVTGPADLHSRSTRVLLDAMQQRGVRRLLKVSAQGVGDSAKRAGWGFRALVATSNLRPAFEDHAIADALVADSALDWTVVRPPILSEAAGGVPLLASEAATTWSWTRVALDDVAAWIVGALDDPRTFGRVVTLRPA